MNDSLERKVLGVSITEYFNILGKKMNQRFSSAVNELESELKQTNIYDETILNEVYKIDHNKIHLIRQSFF